MISSFKYYRNIQAIYKFFFYNRFKFFPGKQPEVFGPFYDYKIGMSLQGKNKLYLNGFGLVQKTKASTRYWLCDQRWGKFNCKVTAILHDDGGLTYRGEHKHTITQPLFQSE